MAQIDTAQEPTVGEQLDALYNELTDVRQVVVASSDGFCVGSHGKEVDDTDGLAALLAAALGVIGTLAEMSRGGDPVETVFRSTGVCISLYPVGRFHVLAVLVEPETMLGTVHYLARRTATTLAASVGTGATT